ncbi:hypothetical protein [Vibrio parahaemolyticus RIMD 2210633]|uniref:Uncharacterized protein n=1 Tax=Vibrio parahaemolyticus serotype O3:K6 (strain RIMD 2210633) TaxID=223926 RepID=Q87QW0_VIBPA|nr:hypothetical protein [Vibrio parahaemolyticus RIMD 2210633]
MKTMAERKKLATMC